MSVSNFKSASLMFSVLAESYNDCSALINVFIQDQSLDLFLSVKDIFCWLIASIPELNLYVQ